MTASTIFVRKVTSKRASSDRHKTRDVEQKRHVTSKQREARFSLNCEGNTLGQTGTAEELPSANVTRSNLVIQSGQWNRRRGLYLPNVSNAFPLEESFSIRAFRKSCASANAGEAPVMGSPPFLTTLTARLIHFREISISCVFMLKGEFSCNGFIDLSFFHSRYLYRREIVRRIDFWHLQTEQTPPERVRDETRKARFRHSTVLDRTVFAAKLV